MKSKFILFLIFISFNGMAQVGVNTTSPQAQLEVQASDKGVLIPRVALTATNSEAPIVNPEGGSLVESTLVFNTATNGSGEEQVTPGYYYWNGNKWVRFNTDSEGKSKYYVALGTTNATVYPTSFTNMPEMTLTFTPVSNVVLVNFSASGFLNPGAGQKSLFFQIMLNGSLVKGFQSTTEDIDNVVNRPIWDINMSYPVTVTPGVEQTININWVFPNYFPQMANQVASPFSAGTSGYFFNAHRLLTIIDPNGGGGFETSSPLPVTNESWSINGNSAIDPLNNFIGTNDDVNIVFKRNGLNAGLISQSNIAFGVQSLNPESAATNVTAIGNRALQLNTSGSFNAAFGSNAIRTNTIGSYNSGFGYNSSVGSNNLTNATALGAFSQVNSSNALVLGSVAGVNGATETVQVGIGTNSPESRLHIVGNTKIVNSSVITSAIDEGNLDIRSSSPQNVNVGASISLGGNTTTTGDSRIFGTIEGRKTNFISGASSGYLAFKTLSGGVLDEKFRITNLGRVGIGTTAPGGQFELSLDQGRKPGTTTWTIVSDARLKTVKGSYEKGLEEILKLNPIVYNYKNDSNRKFELEVLQKPFAGFLAQEVQMIFPEAVEQEEDGFLNFNIHPILIASINAFKEMKSLNNQLLEENQLLKSKLEDIVKRIETLEKK
jgi:hypothetical protein